MCASALSEVIPAVLEGSDGCLLAIGYPGAGDYSFQLFRLNYFPQSLNFSVNFTHDLTIFNNISIFHHFFSLFTCHQLYSLIKDATVNKPGQKSLVQPLMCLTNIFYFSTFCHTHFSFKPLLASVRINLVNIAFSIHNWKDCGESKNEKLLKHMVRVKFKSFHITHPQ